MKIRLSLILLLFVLSTKADAQEPFFKGTKSLETTRIEKDPEIDGIIYKTRQSLDIRFRNVWSAARFYQDGLYNLEENGDLAETGYPYSSENDPNANFNIWNLDLSYRWRFAPGREAILLYGDSTFNLDNRSQSVYLECLDIIINQPERHNVSLRVVYFLDYNSVKNIFKV